MDIHNKRDWLDFQKKHIVRTIRKYWGLGMPSFVLHRRTLATAFTVIERIAEIEFSELTMTLYMCSGSAAKAEF